jgi:hypothetical protein
MAVKEPPDLERLHDNMRTAWVFPGLMQLATGTVEINGTKYMKSATGLAETAMSLEKLRGIVGPLVLTSARAATASADAKKAHASQRFGRPCRFTWVSIKMTGSGHNIVEVHFAIVANFRNLELVTIQRPGAAAASFFNSRSSAGLISS